VRDHYSAVATGVTDYCRPGVAPANVNSAAASTVLARLLSIQNRRLKRAAICQVSETNCHLLGVFGQQPLRLLFSSRKVVSFSFRAHYEGLFHCSDSCQESSSLARSDCGSPFCSK
jgi:hypothetical protein